MKEFTEEELFESDMFEVDIPASHVLGCINLYLAHRSSLCRK